MNNSFIEGSYTVSKQSIFCLQSSYEMYLKCSSISYFSSLIPFLWVDRKTKIAFDQTFNGFSVDSDRSKFFCRTKYSGNVINVCHSYLCNPWPFFCVNCALIHPQLTKMTNHWQRDHHERSDFWATFYSPTSHTLAPLWYFIPISLFMQGHEDDDGNRIHVRWLSNGSVFSKLQSNVFTNTSKQYVCSRRNEALRLHRGYQISDLPISSIPFYPIYWLLNKSCECSCVRHKWRSLDPFV